ncbi:MAG TPA: HAD-IIB family hydrolase [Thermoanaerobaculia bacterium]|nr:HAD-IIB family hydrolase [Thermoanaerobaculia bacterium]
MNRWAVFTDLDGTLLDGTTFDLEPARPALDRLRAANIPVVPVTSKTFAEVEPLARELGLRHALIVESGGGIARRDGDAWSLEALGPSSDVLRDAIDELQRRTGARIARYSAMPAGEAERYSGLSGESLARSQRRDCSEPFIIEAGTAEDVIGAAAAMGFRVRRGGRFLHLGGTGGKGEAVARVREELGRDLTMVALGDAPMDAEFLVLADIPVVIPRRGGTPDPELVLRVPHARVAPAPGPAGWAAAVDAVWRELGNPPWPI